MTKPAKPPSHIDYDKYGYCVICSRNLLIPKVRNGKQIFELSNEYDTITYTLNDSSNMKVVVCKMCKPEVTEKDNDKIMKKVLKGWEKEIDDHPDRWTKEKKKAYMDEYSKKFIKHRKEK